MIKKILAIAIPSAVGVFGIDLLARCIHSAIDKPEGYLYIQDDKYPYIQLDRDPSQYCNNEKVVIIIKKIKTERD